MRYLLVDDEPLALEALKLAMGRADPQAELYGFTLPSKAVEFAGAQQLDAAFLDIELGSVNGLTLAMRLKELQPDLHIIFVTSYDQYAVDAFQIHASGYLLKPVTEEAILRELTFLYGPRGVRSRVTVQTFGGFEVFVSGKPLQFGRSKAKELLAFLIDRRGAGVTNNDACAALWEDQAVGNKRQKSYFRTIVAELQATLREAGIGEILEKSYNRLAIVPEKLDCDSYRFLQGDPQAVNSYRHDYLPSYSWAEFSAGILESRLK